MTMRKMLLLCGLVILILGMVSCAPEGMTTKTYGFFYGILHGFLFPFAVFAKMFALDFDLYAQNNTGMFYWIGYALGVFVLAGGSFYRRK